MITTDFARTLARYNRWQNRTVIAAASDLTHEQRWQDRGAFFRSIAETLNHVLWDDRVWLARLQGDSSAAAEIGALHPYTQTPTDWSDYVRARGDLDDTIITWVDTLSASDFDKATSWVRGSEPVETNFGFNLAHMLNHQAHHRGQVHAMLTQAGVETAPTDLQMLPVIGEPGFRLS